MMWNTSGQCLNQPYIHEASQSLSVLPNKQPVEWMTEELLNLSHKKRDAWMRLQNKDPKSDDPTLQQEYKRLCKLTKFAAEKARNDVVEAHCYLSICTQLTKAYVAETSCNHCY